LILRKIIKIVATRSHILKLKCTKFDIGWSSAPGPAAGAHAAFPTPWLDLRVLLLRQGKGKEKRKGEGRKSKGGKVQPFSPFPRAKVLATALPSCLRILFKLH